MFPVLVLFMLLAAVNAKGVSNVNGASCLYIASNFTAFPFDCPLPDLAYKCRCSDPGFVGTVLNCIETYADDAKDLSFGLKQIIDTCKAQGGVEWEFIALADMLANSTSYLIEYETVPKQTYKARWYLQALKAKEKLQHGYKMNQIRIDNAIKEIGIDKILNTPRYILRNPVLIPRKLYDISKKSVTNLVSQRKLATRYGIYLYMYWAIVMIIASAANVLQWCSPKINNFIQSNKFALLFKRKILCPQVVKPHKFVNGKQKEYNNKFLKRCNSNFVTTMYTMPLRVHAIVILGYILLVVVFCSVNYVIVTPNTVFTCPRGQKYVAIADRTGIIGTTQLPIVFLFFTRNNILSHITGLSYRTFQIFHKWIARVTFILLLLHCSFYLLFVGVRGDYIDRWGLLKWRCANVSFAAILITVTISFFRGFGYEIFKMTHKVCLIVFCVGAWYHCLTLGWTEYLVVCFFLWGIEYLLRVFKIVTSGGVLKAHCDLLLDNKGEPHSIRMIVNPSGWWKPFPGSYCWIYVLKGDMFWQAHPFTIVSTTNVKDYNQLVFSIRVKQGGTKTLASHVAKSDYVHVLIEGPYGNNVPFKQYKETVLIAGGVGMAVIYSMAIDVANILRAKNIRDKESKSGTVSIIWVVPNLESIFAFEEEVFNFKKYQDVLQVEIFISRSLQEPQMEYTQCEVLSIDAGKSVKHHKKVEKFLEELIEMSKDGESFNVNFNDKPHLESEIQTYLNSIEVSPIALISCGPTQMNADVRLAVASCLKNGKCVDYFEEELLW